MIDALLLVVGSTSVDLAGASLPHKDHGRPALRPMAACLRHAAERP